MGNRDLFSRHSISARWLVSYIIVSLITVIFNFVAYVRIDRSVSEQNEYYVKEMLKNKKQDGDNFIHLVQNVSIDLSQRQKIRTLAFESGELKNEKLLLVHDVIDELDAYKKLENEFDNIYIYFPNVDYCVSMGHANVTDLYYDVNIKRFGITKAEWLKTMFDKQRGGFAVFSDGNEERITYFYSVYSVERFVPYAIIAVEVDSKKLLHASSNPSYNENFYICTEDQVVVGHDRSKLAEVKSLVAQHGVAEGIRQFANGKTMICVQSENSHWSYFYLVSNGIFKKNITLARMNVIVFNFIGIFLMVAMAVFVVRLNYNPLRKVMTMLNGNNRGTVSEYQEMSSKLLHVMRENTKMNHSLKSFDSDFVREALLTRLLTENMCAEENKKMIDSLKTVGIVFPYNQFAVLLIYIENNMDMFFDDYNDAEENYRLALIAMENIIDEVFMDKCSINYCNMNGYLCCIVNLKDDRSVSDLENSMRWIKGIIMEHFNISYTVGISNIYSRIDDLSACFEEASRCMKERLYNSSGIILYNALEEKNYTQYCLSDVSEGQILYNLRNSNPQAAIEIIDILLEEKMSGEFASIYSMKSLLYNLIIIINRAFGQIGEEFENRITDVLRRLDTVANKSDFEKIQKEIYGLIEYGCAQNIREITNRIDYLMQQARDYVDQNYADINLSVTAVAQNIDVSLQYLSANFKKNNKVGLAEYITQVRIEKAKELLVQTNLPITAIAERVGYVNSRSFFRSFMKVVGTSPKGYRLLETRRP